MKVWRPLGRPTGQANQTRQQAAPEVITTMKLTICIGSLYSRKKLRDELLDSFGMQSPDDVEILTYIDSGRVPIGAKRNALVKIATGRYIVHCDDDDTVSSNYLPSILAAIERDPFADAILVRGRRTENGGSAVEFDYRIGGTEGEWIGNVLWHSPCHLCPIRADIAKMVPFPELRFAEDMQWLERLKPYLHTSQRAGSAGEVLYNYRWNPNKELGT